MTMLIALLVAQAAHPCMDDAKKLCPGVEPGHGRIAACLKEHKAELSSECKARIAQFREGGEACDADVQRLCPDTKPGKERHACMQQHKDEVSEKCKEFFAKAMEVREGAREVMQSCRRDAQKFCPDVKPGAGRVLECLQQHKAELSKACAARLP